MPIGCGMAYDLASPTEEESQMHRSAFVQPAIAVPALACLLGGCSPLQPVRAASSYTSHTICSETFISGLPAAQVYAETIATTPAYGLIDWLVRYHVDPIKREVSTTIAGGFFSRAVYRDGLGCILVHQTAPPEAPLPKDLLAGAGAPPSLPDIAGPAKVTSAKAALEAAVDRAFAEPPYGPPQRLTKSVVVVRDGRVITERYAPGYDIDTPQLSFSMAKTVINALIGILVRDGRLAVDQPAPVPAWRDPHDPRLCNVTLEFDAAGTPLGSSFFYASARDWARLGMLYLDDGVVGGRRILREGWVRYSSRSTPGAFYGYAAGVWTSLAPTGAEGGPVGTGLPPGTFFANGRLGQFILIVRSERLVVVRLGVTQAPDLGDDGSIPRLVADVIAALH